MEADVAVKWVIC